MKKTRILLIATIFMAMFFLEGCTGLRNVRPVSCKVENISPQGFRKIGMKIALGIENPSVQFSVSEAEALLSAPEGQIAEISASPVTVLKKTTQEYPVDVEITLARGFYVTSLPQLLQNPETLEKCTVDLHLRVKIRGGASKRMDYKDIPLKNFLQLIKL